MKTALRGLILSRLNLFDLRGVLKETLERKGAAGEEVPEGLDPEHMDRDTIIDIIAALESSGSA